MATLEQFSKIVRAMPFKPFVVSMASGKTLTVRHPENVSCSVDGLEMVVHDENGMHFVDTRLVDMMDAAQSSPDKPRKGKGARK